MENGPILNELPVLGLELGSTRIKAVLVDGAGTPLASGVPAPSTSTALMRVEPSSRPRTGSSFKMGPFSILQPPG